MIIAGLGDTGTASSGAIAQSDRIKDIYKRLKRSNNNYVVALIRGRINTNADGTWNLQDYEIIDLLP